MVDFSCQLDIQVEVYSLLKAKWSSRHRPEYEKKLEINSIKVKAMTLCELNERKSKGKKNRGQEKYLGTPSYGSILRII